MLTLLYFFYFNRDNIDDSELHRISNIILIKSRKETSLNNIVAFCMSRCLLYEN